MREKNNQQLSLGMVYDTKATKKSIEQKIFNRFLGCWSRWLPRAIWV